MAFGNGGVMEETKESEKNNNFTESNSNQALGYALATAATAWTLNEYSNK